jgi:uncharacterized protein YjbI with pentapeptide repeats
MLQTLRGEGTSRDQIVSVMVEQMGKQAAGEKQGRKPWTLREFGGQTVWDWLHLLSALAIPVVLAIVGLWFTAQQDARQQQTETQRAQAERELAEQRAQDEALQAYLDQMSSLILNEDLSASNENNKVQVLARARTLTVLGRLDPSRKEAVMQFLAEAGLVQGKEGNQPIISLAQADLSDAPLNFAILSGADLRGANLRHTELIGTDLSDANLSNAALSDADLFRANLSGADLRGAVLERANLNGATLDGGADLSQADLFGAILASADLNDADLSLTDLRSTDLRYVKLQDANLKVADLSNAQGITNAQLDQQAASLEGATMPNGQTYEDWLKSREENGKNSGTS